VSRATGDARRASRRLLAIALATLAGCSWNANEGVTVRHAAEPRGRSTYIMLQRSTGQTLGALEMVRVDGEGLRVSGWLQGLPPGAHAMRIHAVGRCEAPGFESAGPRFEPPASAASETPARIADAPQVIVDREGHARVDIAFPMALLAVERGSGLWDVDGSALVMYMAPTDAQSAGAHAPQTRIACGVITRLRGL